MKKINYLNFQIQFVRREKKIIIKYNSNLLKNIKLIEEREIMIRIGQRRTGWDTDMS